MLTALSFEIARPVAVAAPNRADVACFIGMVARRPGAPLPDAVRAQLRTAGWSGGPWQLEADRIEELWQVPVTLDSWDDFDRLYAWDERALRAGGGTRCASYLGAAVRAFFAHGGRRAVVIRSGDPWPYVGGAARAGVLAERLATLVPARAAAPRPFDATDPPGWRGIEHLYGLPDVSHVCLPDLADACAAEPAALATATEPPAAPEVFVECSGVEPALPADGAVRSSAAPRLDPDGFAAWANVVADVREFLARHRRDALFVSSLPLPQPGARASSFGRAHADTDLPGFLRQCGVLEVEGGNEPAGAASAFVQLAWPWLATARSDDLPQRLEPPEGLLAGVLAANALGRGTFRSVAGTLLPEVRALEPVPQPGLGPQSPTARLAQRMCVIGPEPGGMVLLSDVTTSPDRSWRAGGASRLLATLLRAAGRVGEAQVFEASGPELWTRLRRSLEQLLDGFHRAGAFGGRTRADAFQVRCGRDTMSQNDLDHGRVRVELTVLPAAAVEHITVSLELTGGGAGARLPEVA